MQTFYCYADETGQDTKGRFFLVSVIIMGKDREEIRNKLQKIEQESGKGKKKWTKATLSQKRAYIERILSKGLFDGRIFYSTFSHTTDYPSLIIKTLAQAISKAARGDYKAVIFIDGLGKVERRTVGSGLRKQGIRIRKVRGLRHDSDEFIRVADAVAGFVRDYFEGKPYTLEVYKKAAKGGVLQQI